MSPKDALRDRLVLPKGRVKRRVEIIVDENDVVHVQAVEMATLTLPQPMDGRMVALLLQRVALEYCTKIFCLPATGEMNGQTDSDHGNG